VLALYWKALSAPFVYDDLDQIVNNPSLRSWHATFSRFFLSPVSFTTDFLGTGGSTYRPIYWLTLALDRQIWGIASSSGFHFTNLLLHWANGVLLFQLLRRTKISLLTAATVSIVWLGLPINTEAVAWVSGRAYLLSTFFILLSLLAACSYLTEDLNKRKIGLLIAYFTLSMGALFSHEQGLIVLPLTALLLYTMNCRDRNVWTRLGGVAFVADILYVGAKYRVGAHGGQGAPALWSVGLVFWKYVLWIVAPIHMSVERSTSLPPNTPSLVAVAGWMGVFALFAAVFLLRKRAPPVAVGIVCAGVALLPFCGVIYIYQGMAERFLYLASIGIALLIASFTVTNRKIWKGATIACLALWMAWGAWRLKARVLDWNDPVSLYQGSLEATPGSSTLFYNLGFSLRERGDLDQAIDAYQQAIRIQPKYQRAFASVGEVYAQLGKPTEAIKAYKQSLALQPNDVGSLINYAVAFQQSGNRQLAEEQFKRVIALAPKDSKAQIDLGALYVQEKREDEAIQCFERAIDINPDDPTPYYDLAVMFQQTGRDDLALPFYKKVLRLKPDDPDTLFNMGRMHMQSDQNR